MGDWEQGDVVREVEVVMRFRFGVTADDDPEPGNVIGHAVDAWLEPRERDEFTVLAYQVTETDPGGARRPGGAANASGNLPTGRYCEARVTAEVAGDNGRG